MFAAEIAALQALSIRRMLIQATAFLSIVASALAVWKGLGLVLGTESPIVVVLSGSMEPAFYRGDLLLLTSRTGPVSVGDITVYRAGPIGEIPIVHRVVSVSAPSPATAKGSILTKGDNNPSDDYIGGLYPAGRNRLREDEIVGSVVAWVPYVGYVTIAMNDHPNIKYIGLAALGVYMLFNRE